MMKKLIYGGGGGGSTPTNTGDNLRSEDTAEILIGLCEGPIEGLLEGNKTFYLDDTPLVASDGSENFQDYSLDIKHGDAFQDESIQFQLGGSARSVSVGVELLHEAPITRTTQTGEINYIDVRILVSQLYHVDGDGGTHNATVTFKIEYKKYSDADWTLYSGKEISISGKTTSGYVKDYRIGVDFTETDYYEVRITKITGDSPTTSSGTYNVISWNAFEEVTAGVVEFKNTAIAHLVVRTSDQLSSMPDISGIYKLLKVKIPSNYDPILKTYSGEWDGTFKVAWTDNPSWCLYDIIVNDRYGLNGSFPVEADKWDFYEAAQYCDELVPDGKGGKEARYTLNIFIQDQQGGREMLDYIAATFNATIYEDASNLARLAFDKDSQATHLFSEENVTAEGFTYNFTDPETRYNDLTVTFLNMERDWIEDRRRISDDAMMQSWGRIAQDFVAVGCIREAEAIRRARYRLISNQTEVMGVSFSTTTLANNINVFDTILISDKTMGYSVHGRLHEISEDRLEAKLRDKIFLESGVNYTLGLQTVDGIIEVGLIVREVGYVDTLYFSDKLPENLTEYSVFSLVGDNGSGGSPKPFKVLSISEANGNAGAISIVATEINRNKQYEADYGFELEDGEYSKLPSYQNVPQALSVDFTQRYHSTYKRTELLVSMTLDNLYPYYTGYASVWSRPVGEELWEKREVIAGDTIYNHPPGLYEFKVLPETTLGLLPDFDKAPILLYDCLDLTEPPADVKNFVATPTINNIKFTWDEVTDVDLMGYTIRMGDTWDAGQVLVTHTTDTEFLLTEYFENVSKIMIKAVDSLGNQSVNATYVNTSFSLPKNVQNFYVTPNLDNLRFDWTSIQENGVEYEIRVGESWDSGIMLFRATGFTNTILNPGFGDSGFMIKAITGNGVYSESYRYAKIRLDLAQNRNVVLEIDNAEEGWVGVTNGLELSSLDDVLVMKEGVFFGEHYFPVHHPEVTRARNWYETEGFKFGTRLTFGDLNFTWESEEAQKQNWLYSTSLSEIEGATIQPVITYELTEPYLSKGFRYSQTTGDVNGEIFPNEESGVSYGDARYNEGLILNRILKLDYTNINLPEQFTLKHKVKLSQNSIGYIPVLRLEGPGGNLDLMIVDQNKIVVQSSNGTQIIGNFNRFSYSDFLYVMIRQTESDLILDYFVEYANIKGTKKVVHQPLGTFNKLYIGGRYD